MTFDYNVNALHLIFENKGFSSGNTQTSVLKQQDLAGDDMYIWWTFAGTLGSSGTGKTRLRLNFADSDFYIGDLYEGGKPKINCIYGGDTYEFIPKERIEDLFYTQTELDAGQLDNRYYTETELDAGQLDNRYYTETEQDVTDAAQDATLASHTSTLATHTTGIAANLAATIANAAALVTHKSSSDHDSRYYTETEIDNNVNHLKCNDLSTYVHKVPWSKYFRYRSDNSTALNNEWGFYKTATANVGAGAMIYVPDWLQRYAQAQSKTLTVTNIRLNWDDTVSADYIDRVRVWIVDGDTATKTSKYDNSTNLGSGSTGFRNDDFDVTDFTIDPNVGDCIHLYILLVQGTVASCRFKSLEITYSIS